MKNITSALVTTGAILGGLTWLVMVALFVAKILSYN